MNKQELIEKIEALPAEDYKYRPHIDKKMVLGLVRQLDEPEKVTIPQFTADWIEHFKKTSDWDLFQAMDYLFEHTITCEWIETKDNQELFARAWIFGYEVEKEKRYLVKVKGICGNHETLNREKHSNKWLFSDHEENSLYDTKHIRKELEEAGLAGYSIAQGSSSRR